MADADLKPKEEVASTPAETARTTVTSTDSPVINSQPRAKPSLFRRAVDSFKPAIDPSKLRDGQDVGRTYMLDGDEAEKGGHLGAADEEKTTRTGAVVMEDGTLENGGLQRQLHSRHLQMIALGGSIGTGLFVGAGGSLANGGPASVLIGFLLIGVMLFMVVNALGELAVVFPISGSFSIYSTRFIHPAWGFAMGYNYVLSWIVTLPTELTAAVLVIGYWDTEQKYTPAAWITLLLGWTFLINMLGVRGYGESEFIYSSIKVIAIIGFIILGIVINAGGAPDHHYYGTHTWYDPGAFANGFKGFCSVFVNAAFAFSGTELVGLAAAETQNPRKVLPSATKQVFWRVTFFYIVSLLLVGFLVPYNNPALLNGSGNGASSPFVIAIKQAEIPVLPSIFNAVILIAVLSVGNSATFATSRTLTALASWGQAPKIFTYIDREGRPLTALILVLAFGCIAYVDLSSASTEVFNWLLALGGLSALITWASICLAHIRFRKAWAYNGHTVEELPFKAAFGVWGSWYGFLFNCLILVATFYSALYPPGVDTPTAKGFFITYLAAPIVIAFFIAHLVWFRDPWIKVSDMDIDTGRRDFPSLETLRAERAEVQAMSFFPRWYHHLC